MRRLFVECPSVEREAQGREGLAWLANLGAALDVREWASGFDEGRVEIPRGPFWLERAIMIYGRRVALQLRMEHGPDRAVERPLGAPPWWRTVPLPDPPTRRHG